MYCSKCGRENVDEAVFCNACGKALKPEVALTVNVSKSRTVAGLLGVILGGLGIHRFYLGYVGIGIVQIIVTVLTFGIGGLWGFIEGILILTGSTKADALGMPLRD